MANVDQAAAQQFLSNYSNSDLMGRDDVDREAVIQIMSEYAAERESLAVAAEREECAKAICLECRNPLNYEPAQREDVGHYWSHRHKSLRTLVTCKAEAIRSRASQPASSQPQCNCRAMALSDNGPMPQNCTDKDCQYFNPEPQGGKEAHTEPGHVTNSVSATEASGSEGASGLLASQSPGEIIEHQGRKFVRTGEVRTPQKGEHYEGAGWGAVVLCVMRELDIKANHRNILRELPAEAAPAQTPRCPKCGSVMHQSFVRSSIDSKSAVEMYCDGVECADDDTIHKFVLTSTSELSQFFRPSPESRRELAGRIAAKIKALFNGDLSGGTSVLAIIEEELKRP